MILMINAYDCFQTLKYWVFIILFIRQINPRISMFKLLSIFVKKKTNIFSFYWKLYQKLLINILYLRYYILLIFQRRSHSLELFDKIIICLKALYCFNFCCFQHLLQLIFKFCCSWAFWVLLDNKPIQNLCFLKL